MDATSGAVSPLMHELSAYIASAVDRALPEHVLERAKIHLVDTVAAIVSGSALPPGRRAFGYVETLGGRAECSVFGTRLVTSAVHAAFANGMFAHSDETDDTHPPSRTHPGASVVPAAFSIGDAKVFQDKWSCGRWFWDTTYVHGSCLR